MDATNLAELYDLPTVDWSTITARLGQDLEQAPGSCDGPRRHTCWLATINADGSPHVSGIGGQWHDGAWFFETGASTRKGRNLARDPRCSISVSTFEFDLTIEGRAEMIGDPKVVADVAALFAAGGWPCEVDESGVAITAPFSAPSAGKPPWKLYRLVATSAQALATVEPGGATRWRF
jgi:hypothetical protein